MKPTDILRCEHRVIEKVLDCLQVIALEARERGVLDGVAAEEALLFLRTFADLCHHGKEEERLFPAMVAKGLPRDVGPLAVMVDEHQRGRKLVRRLGTELPAAARGVGEAVERFVSDAMELIAHLHEHIAKEDGVLFPLAERMLDARDQEGLLADFDQFEEEDMGEDVHQRMLDLADGLFERFGKSREEMPSFVASACCHHVTKAHASAS